MNGTVAVAVAQRASHQVLPVITLISWLLTAGIGGYMFGSWIAHDGVAQQRANREGLRPGVIFGHVGLALTGLAVWAAYAITRWPPLAWSAVLVLMPAIGLGLSIVTLWVPYPVAGGPGRAGSGGQLAAPAEDVLASRLTDSTLTHALTVRRLPAGWWMRCSPASQPTRPGGGPGGTQRRSSRRATAPWP